MPKTREKYLVAGFDLYHIRNRTEQRVADSLREQIRRLGIENSVTQQMIQDAYALALNHLPARYSQKGTIVLRDPLRKPVIEEAVTAALERVIQNPK